MKLHVPRASVKTRRQFLHGSLAAAALAAAGRAFAGTAVKLPVRYGLPPGLTLHGDGSITGTATMAGLWKFTVTVTDALGQAADAALSIPVYRH